MLLQELIDEYILLFRRGELTSSQQRELIDWLNADATHQAYYRKMLKLYACIEMTEEDLVKQMQDSVHNRLYKQIYLQRLVADRSSRCSNSNDWKYLNYGILTDGTDNSNTNIWGSRLFKSHSDIG